MRAESHTFVTQSTFGMSSENRDTHSGEGARLSVPHHVRQGDNPSMKFTDYLVTISVPILTSVVIWLHPTESWFRLGGWVLQALGTATAAGGIWQALKPVGRRLRRLLLPASPPVTGRLAILQEGQILAGSGNISDRAEQGASDERRISILETNYRALKSVTDQLDKKPNMGSRPYQKISKSNPAFARQEITKFWQRYASRNSTACVWRRWVRSGFLLDWRLALGHSS